MCALNNVCLQKSKHMAQCESSQEPAINSQIRHFQTINQLDSFGLTTLLQELFHCLLKRERWIAQGFLWFRLLEYLNGRTASMRGCSGEWYQDAGCWEAEGSPPCVFCLVGPSPSHRLSQEEGPHWGRANTQCPCERPCLLALSSFGFVLKAGVLLRGG